MMLLRRLRGPAAATRGAALMTLRQTLRLSARQAVHAIEFDDRILLVGESERGLALLESGKAPNRANDEAEIAARAAIAAAVDTQVDDDDGATPKNLVIPRPPAGLPRRSAPSEAPRTPGLADFRNLLQKAGRP
jgi:flagellar biogenesis protein FliO